MNNCALNNRVYLKTSTSNSERYWTHSSNQLPLKKQTETLRQQSPGILEPKNKWMKRQAMPDPENNRMQRNRRS